MGVSDPFFITGLPRSRTTWLANLFTTGTSFCYHDLTGQIKTLGELRRYLPAANHGDSDSGLVLFYKELLKIYPTSRWLFVQRDLDSAWTATETFARRCNAKLKPDRELKRVLGIKMMEAEKLARDNPRTMFVDYHKLGDIEQIKRIWKHLTPFQQINIPRVKLLQSIKMEPVPCPERFEPMPELVKELLCQS